MIQSLVNIQLDGLKKGLKPIQVPVETIASFIPKYLICLGVFPESTEIDISYTKNQVQFSAFMQPVEGQVGSKMQTDYCRAIQRLYNKNALSITKMTDLAVYGDINEKMQFTDEFRAAYDVNSWVSTLKDSLMPQSSTE